MRHAWLVLALGCGSPSTKSPVDIDGLPAARVGEDIAIGIEAGALAVDGTHVYFVDRGSIGRVAKAGGSSPTTLATGQASASSLDVSTSDVCWVDSGTHAADFRDGSIHCAPKTGGDTRITSAYFPSSLAVDGDTIYWTEIDGESIKRIDKTGTNATTLDVSPTSKLGIALAPAKLVWIASGAEADVVAMDRTTGTKTPLSTQEYAPRGLALDGDDVYWVVQHALSDDGAVRVAKPGAAPVDVVADEPYPSGLVKAAGALYWTSQDRIRTIGLGGGTPSTLVDQGKLGALATDGEYLYWSEPDRKAIVRLPLP